MLDILLITIDKIKNKNISALSEEYIKRFKPFGRLEIIELKPESFSKQNQDRAKKEEAKRIVSCLEKKAKAGFKIYLLDEKGKNFSSLAWAEFLDKSRGQIIFVLGGTLGLDESLKNEYPSVSLSPLTLTHEMARLIFLEQIYRAGTILVGKEYHY